MKDLLIVLIAGILSIVFTIGFMYAVWLLLLKKEGKKTG